MFLVGHLDRRAVQLFLGPYDQAPQFLLVFGLELPHGLIPIGCLYMVPQFREFFKVTIVKRDRVAQRLPDGWCK